MSGDVRALWMCQGWGTEGGEGGVESEDGEEERRCEEEGACRGGAERRRERVEGGWKERWKERRMR